MGRPGRKKQEEEPLSIENEINEEQELNTDEELVEVVEDDLEESIQTDMFKELSELKREVEQLKRSTAPQSPQSQYYPQPLKGEQPKFGSGTRYIGDDDKIRDSKDRPTSISFFSIGQGKVLSTYMKDGSEIQAPYNKPIFFKWATMDIGKSGHADDCIHFCQYDTWSQKEADFIRNSPFYGKTIFDTITQTRGLTPAIASYIDRATAYVESMEQGQLLSLARQYGIEREKPSTIKTKLGQIKLQEYIQENDNFTKSALTNILAANQKAATEQEQRESGT